MCCTRFYEYSRQVSLTFNCISLDNHVDEQVDNGTKLGIETYDNKIDYKNDIENFPTYNKFTIKLV